MAKKDKYGKDGKLTEYEFDPIKYAKDGAQAQAVIWSTNVLNAAVEGIQKGLPLKANPFCGKDTQLLKPDLVFRRTEEEMEEAAKCMDDPVYFATKCFLMTPTGLKPCILRDYQEDYLHHLQHNRFSIFLACRQAGKTLDMLTKVKLKIVKNSSDYHLFANMLKKTNYFYINDIDSIQCCLPIFEIYNIYCSKSLLWKCKYQLYKLKWYFEYGRQERSKSS